MAWSDALGEPVRAVSRSYPTGKLCVDLYHDLSSVGRSQKPGIGTAVRVAMQWARADLHVFRWNDPRPALHMLGPMLLRRVTRTRDTAPAAGEGSSA
jgi:hypothetical protein